MRRANNDLRHLAQQKKVFLWEAAEKYGLSDSNFSKLLRRELSDVQKERIRQIINELSKKSKQ